MKKLSLTFYVLVIFLWAPLFFVCLKGLSLIGFQKLFSSSDILSALEQSLFLATLSAFLSTLTATITAFALKNKSKKIKLFVDTALLIPLTLPEISLGIALMTWFLKLSLPLGWSTLIIAHWGFSFTYAMFVMSASVSTMDQRLVDAAKDLGAGAWTVFRHAILPQLMPALMASFIMCFGLSLDDFLISFFVKGMDQNTLPIKIFSMLRISFGPEIYTLSLLLCIASILAVLASQLWLNKKPQPK